MCVHRCVKARDFEAGSLAESRAHQLARLAGHRARERGVWVGVILLSLPPGAGYRHVPAQPAFMQELRI